MLPKITGAQRDFSAGELDVTMKRADENPLMKAGARQMANWRILNSHIVQNRSGRTALFLETGRTDKVLMAPGNLFYLVFGNGYLRVYNAAGAQVFSSAVKGDGITAIPWTGTSAKSVVWVVSGFLIYITYADGAPNNVPQILTWDGVSQTSTWTLATYTETVTPGGQKRTPFYRISPQNVTMNPSGSTGNITLAFSAPIVVAGMVGTRMTYCGRQVIITGVNTVTIAANARTGIFAANNTVTGGTSGAIGFIRSIVGQPAGTVTMNVALTTAASFQVGEAISTSTPATATITAFTNTSPAGTTATALVAEPLPIAQTLTPAGTPIGTINIGDVVLGSVSGAKGIVAGGGAGTQTLFLGIAATSLAPGLTIAGTLSGATGFIAVITPGSAGTCTVTISLNAGSPAFGTEAVVIQTIAGTINATNPGAVATAIIVQLLPSTPAGGVNVFVATDKVVGPFGTLPLSGVANANPQAVSIWADEVMNAFRGYPASVFFDQNRLGLCNIPSVPSGIVWSTFGLTADLWVDATSTLITPDNAIFELAPGKSQVLFGVAGPESGEFIFCDNHVYYIPITVQNPLVPGSVAFNVLSSDGAANVQPRAVEEVIFYVNAGGLRVKAVIAPGAYYRPFNTEDTSENHTHLFTSIIALAAPNSDGTFPERYVYALNSSGSLVVGKYAIKDGQIAGVVGWAPWTGAGTIGWVSALLAEVTLWTAYSPNSIPAVNVIEKIDDTQYLDTAMSVNSVPTAFTPPGGKGPLWWLPGGSVTLMDTGARMMGTYQINANGFIIPQFNGGENLLSAGLVAGQPWTATLEPFVPDAQPGQDQHQRMFKRRVSRMAVYVSNSTGFLMARLFSGPLTRTSPALGTVMNIRRVTTWNQDDDPTQPPPLREEAQRWRPLGRAYDPRVAVIKDTPGPLVVHEMGLEASI